MDAVSLAVAAALSKRAKQDLTPYRTAAQQDVIDSGKAGTAALALTDKKLHYLSELTKGQAWDTETGTTPAYQQTVPSGAKCVAVNKVGGKTVVMNQLVKNGNFADFNSWEKMQTYPYWSVTTPGKVTIDISGVLTGYFAGFIQTLNTITGNSYLILFTVSDYYKEGTLSVNRAYLTETWGNYPIGPSVGITGNGSYAYFATASNYNMKVGIQIQSSETGVLKESISNFMVIDLTQMFGSGNEPTTVEAFKALFPEDYYAYDAGSLLSANVESVESKDSNSVSLGSLSIPAALRTAYPLHSVGNAYDEYDIERKKFVKRVGTQSVTGAIGDTITLTGCDTTATAFVCAKDIGTLASGVLTLTAAATNENVYFLLATAVETDISEYFSDDNLLTAEAGGSLTFTQDNTAESMLPIPNGTEYAVQLSDAT